MEEQTKQASSAPQANKDDIEKNKMMAIVGYIFPILFFYSASFRWKK